LLEDLGMRGTLVDVVFEDVPPGEDDVVQISNGHEIFDKGRFVVSALAETNGSHLRKRADGFGETAAHCFNAGDHGGGNGTEPDDHDAELAFCRCGLLSRGLLAAFFASAHSSFQPSLMK